STHPYAARIAASFDAEYSPRKLESFEEMPGCGILGRVSGTRIAPGITAWLGSCSISIPREIPVSNSSIACIAFDGEFLGFYTLKGAVRPEIDRLIQDLTPQYEIALLSGDNQRQRNHFRELFGSDTRLHFEQSPHDKLGFISQ